MREGKLIHSKLPDLLPDAEVPQWIARVVVAGGIASTRTTIGQALRTDGYHVREVGDQRALLHHLEEAEFSGDPPDMVILIDGRQVQSLDALQSIRQEWWAIPVLVVSSGPEPDFEDEVLRLGVQSVFHPPFSVTELRRVVRASLDPAF